MQQRNNFGSQKHSEKHQYGSNRMPEKAAIAAPTFINQHNQSKSNGDLQKQQRVAIGLNEIPEKRVKNHTLLEQQILSQFAQLIRVRMQATRHLNLSIPPVVESKQHRAFLQIKMDQIFLNSGRTAFKIDKDLIRQTLQQVQSSQNSDFHPQQINSEKQKNSQSGFLEIEANYASLPKQFGAKITKILDCSNNDTSANLNGKEDNCAICRHTCKYQIVPSQNNQNSDQEQLQLQKSDLFQLCLNLVKKIQNINCEDKFYCLQSRLPSQDTINQEKDKLKFEAQTMNICPLDFSRVLLKLQRSDGNVENGSDSIDEVDVHFTMLMPNTNFKIRTIPQMKLVSTPLSRLLLGKTSTSSTANSNSQQQQPNNNNNGQSGFSLPSSGFITLDSEERVIPLMPQDPFLQETPAVGIWLWNVEDLRSPYVWSVCTRFVFCRNFRPQSGKMPTLQSNQFLLVNFKKNLQAQFLMLQVETDGQWVIYSDQQRISVSDVGEGGHTDYLTFSGMQLDQTISVQDFLNSKADHHVSDQPSNQIARNLNPHQQISAAKYSTETNARARSGTGKQATASLTAEYNSRYSRNQEDKKVAVGRVNPSPPTPKTVSGATTQIHGQIHGQGKNDHAGQRKDLKIQTTQVAGSQSQGRQIGGVQRDSKTESMQDDQTSILRNNLRSNTPVSANTSRSRNDQSQSRNNQKVQQPQHPSSQNQPSITSAANNTSNTVLFKHNDLEREANASPRTRQAMANQQAEIYRLNHEVASLKAQLLQAQRALQSTNRLQNDSGQEIAAEIECELPNQETAQFAPSLQSSHTKDSYQQKLELGQLETIKNFYQNHGYQSHQPRTTIASATHNSSNNTQSLRVINNQAAEPIDNQRENTSTNNFFSQQVGGHGHTAQTGPETTSNGTRVLAPLRGVHRPQQQTSSLSPKDLNPSQGNNRSRNLRKQTNNAVNNQNNNNPQIAQHSALLPRHDQENNNDDGTGRLFYMNGNQLPHARNQILYKSWSEQTLTTMAKLRKETSIEGQDQQLGPDQQNHQRIGGGGGPQSTKMAGKQQSRNTNLINIADNIEDQLQMPTLHKRSFSSSLLGAANNGGTVNNNQSNSGANNTNTAEELAELMNRAHVGSKASRNVLNDVNRKAGDQQHVVNGQDNDLLIEQNNNIGGAAGQVGYNKMTGSKQIMKNQTQTAASIGANTSQQPKSSDLDRMVAVHTRNNNNAKKAGAHQKQHQKHPKHSSPTQQHNKGHSSILEQRINGKLDPFEETKSQKDDDSDDLNVSSQGDAVGELAAHASQSSNSENGDHTYNPYSFKRLQDAIFKKQDSKNLSKATEGNSGSVTQPSHMKDSVQFMPLQRQAVKQQVATELQNSTSYNEAHQTNQSRTTKHEQHLDLPFQMQTPQQQPHNFFQGVPKQSQYLMKLSPQDANQNNQASPSCGTALHNLHTLDSKLTFQQKQQNTILSKQQLQSQASPIVHNAMMSSQQRELFHPTPSSDSPTAIKFKDLDQAERQLLSPSLEQQASQPTESEQGSSSYIMLLDPNNKASQQHSFIMMDQRQDQNNNNFSQDFGLLHQSASQDSSLENQQQNQITNQHQKEKSGSEQDNQILAMINKKSDWTMDMPKIQYQPEQDDDEDGDSNGSNKIDQDNPNLDDDDDQNNDILQHQDFLSEDSDNNQE